MSAVLAVFGGSFNPPHVAHTLAAAYALSAYAIDSLIVVPTASHPFGKPLAPFSHRLRMCELAFGDLRRVEISTIERELPAPSLTVHTLEALSARYTGHTLRLLLGSDLLAETHTWHDFARIEQLALPLIIERQGHERSGSGAPALPNVSSTEIRRRLQAGLPTEGLLSPAVAQYAIAQQLYL